MTTPRTIDQTYNKPTCYEVAINGEIVAYVARRTKSMLLEIARQNADKILDQIRDEDGIPKYSKESGWAFDNVRVYFTGRTERDAACELMQ